MTSTYAFFLRSELKRKLSNSIKDCTPELLEALWSDSSFVDSIVQSPQMSDTVDLYGVQDRYIEQLRETLAQG